MTAHSTPSGHRSLQRGDEATQAKRSDNQSKRVRSKDRPDGRVTARLISKVKEMILTGELTPGSKLPPERELAKTFGVNRASLRQVLKVLEIMGVLSQRVGDGTYLNDSAESILDEPLDFLVLLDDLSHHELFETRLIVEPELAARAAERATADDMVLLRKAIKDLESCQTTNERLDADMAFHECIFRAAGNRICHLLFRVVHRTLLTSMTQLAGRVGLERPLSFHRAIYTAIHNRDAQTAWRTMHEHISDAKALLGPARAPGTPRRPEERTASLDS